MGWSRRPNPKNLYGLFRPLRHKDQVDPDMWHMFYFHGLKLLKS